MHRSSKSRCARAVLVAACGAVLAGGGTAAADVLVDVLSGDKSKGTVNPSGERESYRMALPVGSRITVKAKGLKGFLPSLALEDPSPETAAQGTEKGASAAVSGFTATSSGVWSAVVGSRTGATGDYSLSVKWTVPKALEFDVETEDEAPVLVPVYLAGGSRITASTRSDDETETVLESVSGPDGYESPNDGGAHEFTAPVTGEYGFRISRAAPGFGGLVLRIKPPKKSKRKIDVTSKTLGSGADAFAIGAVIGPGGGEVFVPDLGIGGLDDISGSGVSIPGGALAFPGVILVGSAPALDPEGDEAPVGATVSFGPDGLQFQDGLQATLTIPWNIGLAGGSPDDVVIYTRNAKGVVTEVPRPYDFSTPGFVSFPASHFSSYVAAASPSSGMGIGDIDTFGTGLDIAEATGFGNAQRLLWMCTGGVVLREYVDDAGAPTAQDFAGGGASSADGTSRLAFDFGTTLTSVFEFAGDVYVSTDLVVYRIDLSTNQVFRVAGIRGDSGDSGDGGAPTAARFTSITDLFVDSAGVLFVTDGGANRIRAIDVAGTIDAFAGDGSTGAPAAGEAASQASLTLVRGIAEGSQDGHYFVVETNRVDRVRSDTGVIEVWSGQPDASTGCVTTTSGAAAAAYSRLTSIAADPDRGQLYVTDNDCHAIYMVSEANGSVQVLFGTPPDPGMSLAGALSGALASPGSVVAESAVGGVRSIVFRDTGNGIVRSLRFTSP
ncbi:MAG: hypothetical protein HMLKMBBP_03147 [Planctomycetes bacterium]|nr:hypothetical protein [Planctomycetota bacterium]